MIVAVLHELHLPVIFGICICKIGCLYMECYRCYSRRNGGCWCWGFGWRFRGCCSGCCSGCSGCFGRCFGRWFGRCFGRCFGGCSEAFLFLADATGAVARSSTSLLVGARLSRGAAAINVSLVVVLDGVTVGSWLTLSLGADATGTVARSSTSLLVGARLSRGA